MTETRSFTTTPLLRDLPPSLSVRSVREGRALDYEGLVQRVEELAAAFVAATGGEPGRIVIAPRNGLDGLIALFACWVAGNCAVLVNPGLAEEEKSRVIESTTPRLWVDGSALRLLPGTDEPAPWPEAALILMTSGTTGTPKGVTHSLETLETRLKLNVAEIGPDALARTLCPLPLFFGHGLIGNCLTPLHAGQALHLLDAPGLKDYAAFGPLVDDLGITFLSSVPSMWRMILRSSPPPTSSLTRVHVGSAPLPLALWRDIEDWCGTSEVFNTYGMTETANWFSGGLRPEAGEGFVGRPWGGGVMVRRGGTLFETGRGEVAVRSPSRMLGLWKTGKQPETRDGFLMTGDIGELADDGSLRLIGRTKNEINRGGIKILAEEIDMLLERHPLVAEACGFGLADEIAGELVGAVVRLKDGASATERDLIAWCRDRARPEAVPHRIAVVEEIAKTDRGKLARVEIRATMERLWC